MCAEFRAGLRLIDDGSGGLTCTSLSRLVLVPSFVPVRLSVRDEHYSSAAVTYLPPL